MSATAAMNMNRPVLIMAGGTGGHVFPALAVAREILSRDIPVVWLGTRQGIEARIVPAAGIPIEWVSVSGLRGKRLSRLIKAPFMIMLAAWQCLGILRRNKPRAVLGMGGFASGPGGMMARLMGKPLCVHEQNAIAGMTNRYLARVANRVLEAFPGSFPAKTKTTVTGNPVRKEIRELVPPAERFAGRQGELRILVLGGSLGAQALNNVVPEMLRLFGVNMPVVRHQVGERNLDQARQAYAELADQQQIEVVPFIEDMSEAYAWADLVICRAGALTISEICCVGVAAIFVPYPYAVDDHQTRNAEFLVQAGAASLVQQHELDANKLFSMVSELNADRTRLLTMAEAARKQAKPDADKQVADICCALGEGRS